MRQIFNFQIYKRIIKGDRMSELPSEKRDALSPRYAVMWAAFFIIFFFVTIVISTGFWVGFLLLVISVLLFIDLGLKFKFTSAILSKSFSSYYDQKISPLRKFGKKFYIIGFSILIILFVSYKVSNTEMYHKWMEDRNISSMKSGIDDLLETRNESSIIDSLNSFVGRIKYHDGDKKFDQYRQLISKIISYSLNNKLTKVINDIEGKLILSLGRSTTFDNSMIDQILLLYREKGVLLTNTVGVFNKYEENSFKQIIPVCDPKFLNVEFVDYLKNELESFKKIDHTSAIDYIKVDTRSQKKINEIRSILIECKINIDQQLMTLINSINDFTLAKTKYESTLVYVPDEPVYEEPVYNGAFYLSSTYFSEYSDVTGSGILVRSSGKYYIIMGAAKPRNPFAENLGGYVSGGYESSIIIRGRSRPATVVNLSDLESYREDQAAHAEKVRNAKQKYQGEINDYRESLQRYNESKNKIDELKSVADRLASVMIANIQEIL
jgi:hypothetical protein